MVASRVRRFINRPRTAAVMGLFLLGILVPVLSVACAEDEGTPMWCDGISRMVAPDGACVPRDSDASLPDAEFVIPEAGVGDTFALDSGADAGVDAEDANPDALASKRLPNRNPKAKIFETRLPNRNSEGENLRSETAEPKSEDQNLRNETPEPKSEG